MRRNPSRMPPDAQNHTIAGASHRSPRNTPNSRRRPSPTLPVTRSPLTRPPAMQFPVQSDATRHNSPPRPSSSQRPLSLDDRSPTHARFLIAHHRILRGVRH
ncbi:hypothetical protein K456DRAFT_473849 [Colletotrichum gloeosporioides 23]|nr:hypothetical protein K456DRAFT_473849 [Colletotrichum gloeosporioides 23]